MVPTRARSTSNVSSFYHTCIHQQSSMDLITASGRSPSATAASFIRTTRKADPEQSFVEAVKEKYRGEQDDSKPEANEITISGKVAEEIGFDKIRAVQARLHELKIVLVDGRRISKARKKPGEIQKVCPMIEELDLSRNPICNFSEIVNICYELSHLKVLKIK